MGIGERIQKARRDRLEMTQRELAMALRVDQATVSHWERGINEPRAYLLQRLSELTGLPVDWFFEDEEAQH